MIKIDIGSKETGTDKTSSCEIYQDDRRLSSGILIVKNWEMIEDLNLISHIL